MTMDEVKKRLARFAGQAVEIKTLGTRERTYVGIFRNNDSFDFEGVLIHGFPHTGRVLTDFADHSGFYELSENYPKYIYARDILTIWKSTLAS